MIKKMKQAEEESKMKHAEGEGQEMKQAEGEEKEMAGAEEAKAEQAEQDEPEADEDHADIAKDKELILSMIKKYMGDEDEPEAAMERAHEAYQAYSEMGYEKEEAMKCAAHTMKLAKHMASKKHAEAGKGEKESEEKKEAVPQNPKADPKKYVGAKESEIRLTAKVAMLERELKKRELSEMLDKKLKESGLGRAETDKIRDLIGAPKSESQILDTIKIFKEAFSVRGGEAPAKKGDFFVSMERAEAPAKKIGKINFSDL